MKTYPTNTVVLKISCATEIFYKKQFFLNIIFNDKYMLNNIPAQLLVLLYFHFLYTYIYIKVRINMVF